MTLAKADTALRQTEAELAKLREEHQALSVELTAVKRGLNTSTERAEKLHEEGQVMTMGPLRTVGAHLTFLLLSVQIHYFILKLQT